MKFNFASVTLFFTAAVSTVAAMPAASAPLELTPREFDIANNALHNMEHYNTKRSLLSEADIVKRESQIVTDILTIIKDTNLAPGVIEYFISDPTLSNITINVIVSAIKNGWINLDTLLKSLNDSGLAVDVIQNLINDCAFYAQIFKLVGQWLENLPNIIANLLGINAAAVSSAVDKREIARMGAEYISPVYARDTQDILTSLMESLKNSGLANQVVEALVVDDDFYTWGGELISRLFSSGAITLGELIDALVDSGLIPSLIKAFLNIDTLKSVIVNALAAAFGNCKDTSTTSSIVTTPTGGPAPTVTTGSADLSSLLSGTSFSTVTTTGTPSKCKKKKRST
ncbi:hypothetical protein FOB58_004718 [Candida parapsilosis]|uniref:Opaque-phase-specific protein OP4 n=1 Tax=Candida parapsilosis TaxID=5480 RepID=A0A8X7NKW7_CANPA|nr:hypothetical protein FOB58_004718 [Candida parapsilosis]KAF6045182.1 hypothetical protein FOB59_004658 [Candida parapsilosis]KAF6048673.1 hypothetical protein FOB60_004057 [Candida parapsilosis]KAF6060674.1 hypothetical protein FOB61_004683 [Candida parapsilosis]